MLVITPTHRRIRPVRGLYFLLAKIQHLLLLVPVWLYRRRCVLVLLNKNESGFDSNELLFDEEDEDVDVDEEESVVFV